jgi:metal-sulfur cluster biosynthetic enzyme
MEMAEARRHEVLARLDMVTDPELDEPVTALGFIREIEIDATGGVDVAFRLPTYWCSANFAFLMADDMRREVGALPWVREVRPRLLDHMYAEAINAGVARGASFRQVFGAEITDETLESLRMKFLRKAFQRRQEAVLVAMIDAGWQAPALVRLDLAGLDAVSLPAPDWPTKRHRYVEMQARLAAAPLDPSDPAFVTLDGAPLALDGFDLHLQTLRSVRLNMEFNGALCRGLLAAREAMPDFAAQFPAPQP